MLRKTPLVTVTPGTPGQAYRAASHTCYATPPDGTNGDSTPPPVPPDGTGVTPAAGTPIWLEPRSGDPYASLAPAPVGYSCRYEVVFVYAPGEDTPATVYNIVCSEG